MPKIFEIAKDLDIGAIDLVEKLKSEGFEVRNHMSMLSEADTEKALALFRPSEDDKPKTKKKTKKKVAKKVVKKKVVKKVAKASAPDVQAEVAEEPKVEVAPEVVSEEATEKKTTKKASVVRKKASTIKEEKEQKAIEKAKREEEEKLKAEQAKDRPKGLQVVYDPLSEQNAEQSDESTNEEGTVENIDDTRKKPHSFTPVYVPEEKEVQPQQPQKRDVNDLAGPSPQAGAGTSGDTTKKRMGDLAQIMTKGKAPKKDLTQIRADEELKSYSMGIVGKVAYTPVGKKKIYSGPSKQTEITEVKDSKRVINIPGVATGAELAKKLKVKFKEFANKALDMNLLLKSDDYIGITLADELAALYDYRVNDTSFNEEEILDKPVKNDESLPIRYPVVTIMGHVDHGKTTLLDYIREAKVAEGEAGGITQHIGAYQVDVSGSKITFLDTPGHAAFGNMRQRGANVTDIVVLVVAADDGVMPQTKESIKFCRNADVPIIIAVNKMDKEQANPDRVKQELVEFNLTPEDWGGDTIFCPISALKGDGVDDLLENIKLQAEMMELRADPKGKAEGVVIESRLEDGRGPVATVLVQTGTLKKGDSIVVGETYGRARSLMDHRGNQLDKVGPSTPIQILGLNEAASPGDTLNITKNEREAKKIVDNRVTERKKLESASSKKEVTSLEDFFATAADSEEKKILKLIVRADVQGSYEAVKNSLEGLGNEEVAVEVIGGGVGAINDNDVMLASSSKGYILGFNMRPITSARRLSEEQGVDVKTYSIIYELIQDVTAALEGLLDPERIEVYIGRAQVKETFSVPKVGVIAGSAVIDGKIKKGCNIRLLREGKIVYDGKMSSLKRFKDDVKEVTNGLECGIGLENFNDVKSNDVFEAYMLEEKARKLEVSEGLVN